MLYGAITVLLGIFVSELYANGNIRNVGIAIAATYELRAICNPPAVAGNVTMKSFST